MHRSAACVLVASAVLAQPAAADYGLTIIPLQHRPAEQIVPSLRPLVEQGGAISSMGDKILLRVSPGNLDELRTTIAALDTPLRRLVVSVRQGEVREWSGGGLGVDGRLAPGNSRVIIRGGAIGRGIGHTTCIRVKFYGCSAAQPFIQKDTINIVTLNSGHFESS